MRQMIGCSVRARDGCMKIALLILYTTSLVGSSFALTVKLFVGFVLGITTAFVLLFATTL